MIDFCKDFATHVDSSRKKKDQHHEPFKELPVDIHVADPILPAVIYEQPPFPARIREHSFVTSVINKSERRVDEPEDQIRVDPQVALIKDLATNDVLDSNINFFVVSTNLVTA